MIAQRAIALWAGRTGTALVLVSWLMISRISNFSFLLWVGLMLSGAVMCFYGGARRSKWFFFPGFVAVIVTAGVLITAAEHPLRLDCYRLHGIHVAVDVGPKSMKAVLLVFDN